MGRLDVYVRLVSETVVCPTIPTMAHGRGGIFYTKIGDLRPTILVLVVLDGASFEASGGQQRQPVRWAFIPLYWPIHPWT
jgi:hypothetical protein